MSYSLRGGCGAADKPARAALARARRAAATLEPAHGGDQRASLDASAARLIARGEERPIAGRIETLLSSVRGRGRVPPGA